MQTQKILVVILLFTIFDFRIPILNRISKIVNQKYVWSEYAPRETFYS